VFILFYIILKLVSNIGGVAGNLVVRALGK
jgi:hypothetical protein